MAFIEYEQSGLEDAPELGPALERASDLHPVGHDDDGGVLEGVQQLLGRALLLPTVVLLLHLERLTLRQAR